VASRHLLSALKIIGISVPVTWIWLEWGREAYGLLFAKLSIPIFGALGMTTIMPEGSRDRFINYLPFLILMVVTPRMTLLRRSAGIVIGFVVIFLFQVLFIYVSEVAGVERGVVEDTQVYARYLPIMLLCDAFPLALWAIIAKDFIQEITSKVFEESSAG
jgi:hypothetical protein